MFPLVYLVWYQENSTLRALAWEQLFHLVNLLPRLSAPTLSTNYTSYVKCPEMYAQYNCFKFPQVAKATLPLGPGGTV